ncbi:MAG: AMP-binding protein, partial [Bdellovibrionota bacterium]
NRAGLKPGDRVGFVSGNSYFRLIAELAAMSGGFVAVPVFAGYPQALIGDLLEFAGVKLVVLDSGEFVPLLKSGIPCITLKNPALDFKRAPALASILSQSTLTPGQEEALVARWTAIGPHDPALIMFTSGTSGKPKGVILTHGNLMSQQRALDLLWKPRAGMRFLCYLPWHHSFGGLFERFFALHSGGCLAIDDSAGKDVGRLIDNFAAIRPHVFFSVPKVYQEIVARFLVDREVERRFFHDELEFVFTAAAPLPLAISAVFKSKRVPVVEGWGLTETSPCCTLTPISLERTPGVVGLPLPGVELSLDADGEILIRGPNVMKGYLDRPEDTAQVLSSAGWFRTGDLGEWTEGGLKLISRKDRMFKLSNGEKIFPSIIEERIKSRCRYIKHAYVWGQGLVEPRLLVFPNTELFQSTVMNEGDPCCYPKCAEELASCL